MPSGDPVSASVPAWSPLRDARLPVGVEQEFPSLISGNEAELLCDGDQAFSAMLRAIEEARTDVSVEVYRFASDGIGRRFARTMAEARRRGVRVRVLVDSAGSRATPRSFFGWMRAHGLEITGVNPLRRILAGASIFGWRDHRKLLLMDHAAAFVGGLNLCRQSAGPLQGGCGWHDAAVRLRGPVVAALGRSFEQAWRQETPRARAGPIPEVPVPGPAGPVEAMVLQSGTSGRGPFYRLLREMIRQSRSRVWIASPYFLPPRSLRRELVRAARRGVDVRILVPGLSDCPLVLWASQRLYARLLGAGVRLFEWTGAMMHAKVALVDDSWSTIGSYNLDPLSLFRNRELNVALLGTRTAGAFAGMLEEDWRRSRELGHGPWNARSRWRRLRERLSSSFRSLL